MWRWPSARAAPFPDGPVRGGLLIAARSGFSILHGLVSYNHFAYSDTVNTAFLGTLMRPPYRRTSPALPPRVTRSTTSIRMTAATDQQRSGPVAIRQEHSDDFRLPVLLRQYFNLMEAKMCNLSLARDFNQITEILILPISHACRGRLSFFIEVDHQPVYQQFSWYRGDK